MWVPKETECLWLQDIDEATPAGASCLIGREKYLAVQYTDGALGVIMTDDAEAAPWRGSGERSSGSQHGKGERHEYR